jgi:hypothetical protein
VVLSLLIVLKSMKMVALAGCQDMARLLSR